MKTIINWFKTMEDVKKTLDVLDKKWYTWNDWDNLLDCKYTLDSIKGFIDNDICLNLNNGLVSRGSNAPINVINFKDYINPKPKRWDRVLVWSKEWDIKKERIFLVEIEWTYEPYICVTENAEDEFLSDALFSTRSWKYMEIIPEKKEEITELTLEQIAEKFWVDTKNLRIKE